MSKLDLDELEQKARAATPGPWTAEPFFRAGDSEPAWRIFLRGHDNPHTNSRDCDWTERDAAHIAANSPEVTRLLVAIARAAEAFVKQQGSNGYGPRGDFATSEFNDLVLALERAGR